MALELQGRHPVRMRSHDVDSPMPAPQRHVLAMHERPGRRRRGLPPAVAALVGAARPLEPDRVLAPAVRANEAVRPATAEEILRASFVVREHPLEPVGGHRIRKFGLIRHAPLMAMNVKGTSSVRMENMQTCGFKQTSHPTEFSSRKPCSGGNQNLVAADSKQ